MTIKICNNYNQKHISIFKGKLFTEINGGTKVIPNSDIFRQADAVKGVTYKQNENIPVKKPDINTSDIITNEKLSHELLEKINTLVADIKSKLYDVALAEKDIDSADLLKRAIEAKSIQEVNKIYKEILDNIC